NRDGQSDGGPKLQRWNVPGPWSSGAGRANLVPGALRSAVLRAAWRGGSEGTRDTARRAATRSADGHGGRVFDAGAAGFPNDGKTEQSGARAVAGPAALGRRTLCAAAEAGRTLRLAGFLERHTNRGTPGGGTGVVTRSRAVVS